MISPLSNEQKAVFFTKLQQLLTEGEFVSTYKFGLLLALTRWAVENPDHPETSPVDVGLFARHFLALYWPQAQPFRAQGEATALAVAESPPRWDGQSLLLQERAGQVLVVIRSIREARSAGHLQLHRLPGELRDRLLREVKDCIRNEPLWKLHKVGGVEVDFLYRRGRKASQIVFEPGIVACLAAFSPLIEHVVRSAWLQFVLRYNAPMLGSVAQVEAFLFPDGRNSLAAWRPVLETLQGLNCFYCCEPMSPRTVAVDHFLPWAKYPRDLGQNFVLAHAECNSQKRDHMPSADHLERWCNRNERELERMSTAFDGARLPHDWPTVRRAASSLYGIVEEAQARVWERKRDMIPLDVKWRSLLGVG